MFRAGVVSFLILATSAQPVLCCCSVQPLLEVLHNGSARVQRCCPTHRQDESSKVPNPNRGDPCNCRDTAPEAIALPPDVATARLVQSLLDELSIHLFSFQADLALSLEAVIRHGTTDPPIALQFLASDSLLEILQILRC